MAILKFRKLTRAQFDALSIYDLNTRYTVEEPDGTLVEYIGDRPVSGGGSAVDSEQIEDLELEASRLDGEVIRVEQKVDAHIEDLDNPHGVTAEQVDTYVKTTIDNKDTATLQAAKDYTYSRVEIDNKDTAIMNKANNLENANMFKDVNYNNVNGVLTFTRYDDTTKEIDLPLELLVESGYYDEVTNELVLVLANGSEIRIPVGNLLTDLDAHNIRFNGSGTNYLTAKTEVESAVKELDTRVKTNADGKLDKNTNITGATKTKITYDSKGLVTAGADLVEADIPALSASKITQTASARFVTDTEKTTWNGKQDNLIAGANISIVGNTISASGGDGGGILDAPSDDKLYGRKNNTWEEIELDVDLVEADIPALSPSKITQTASARFVTDTEKNTWNNKVDKVTGKDLSSNDFTDVDREKVISVQYGAQVNPTPAEIKVQYESNSNTNAFDNTLKGKLEGIEEGAQVNAVKSVSGKIGDVVLDKGDVGLGNVENIAPLNMPISNATNTKFDTKLDKIWTDITEQTSTLLTDLLVINRGTVAYKATLGNLLSNITTVELFEVVTELPASGVPNKIYLVTKNTPEGNDGFDEYAWIDGDWELLGTLAIDLSNYYPREEADIKFGNKISIPQYTVPYRTAADSGEANASLSVTDSADAETIAKRYTDGRLKVGDAVDPLDAINKGIVDSTLVKLTDPRLTDARNPLAHTHPNATTGASGYMSGSDKTKLDGIEEGAQVNVKSDWDATTGDAEILNKPTIDGLLGGLASIGFVKRNGANSYTIDTSNYQPLDDDLTAIAGLSGTSGFLKKTSSNTWSLDTSVYLTAITKTQVEAVLTGTITTHTHNASAIVEDASHRFVTDTEKATWDNKVDKVAGKGLSTNDLDNTRLAQLNKVATIETYIPAETNETNKLADKQFVIDSVQSLAARYVTYDAAGAPFPSKAALMSATDFYHQGVIVSGLLAGDNTLVSTDEDNDNLQSSYFYDGASWLFRYTIGSAFTVAQQSAIDSGITSAKVSTYDSYASEIAGKATKIEIAQNRVPARIATGIGEVDGSLPISSQNTNNTIAYRTATGTLRASNATDSMDLVPLGQVTAMLDDMFNIEIWESGD